MNEGTASLSMVYMAPLETIYEHDERDLEAGKNTTTRRCRSSGRGPPRGNATTYSRPSGCRWFACVTLLVAAALAVALVAVLGALYLVLDPKLPRYTVHSLNVTAFGMDDDLTARARFDASVRFENPNRAIGISYEEGSSLAVWYGGYRLSEGALPAFYQGHHDAAVVHVSMSEALLRGTGVVEAMRHVNGAGGGELPLVFRGEVPVRVKVGPVTTGKVTPVVLCDMVLDRLSTEGAIRVKSMTCKFKFCEKKQTKLDWPLRCFSFAIIHDMDKAEMKKAAEESNPILDTKSVTKDEYYMPIISGSSHRDDTIGNKRLDWEMDDRTETRLEPAREDYMQYDMMQIFSLKLAKSPINSASLQLYGYMAARDEFDLKLNYVFRRSRDDPIIVQQGSLIEMTGPKRCIALSCDVLLEFDMRIKNRERRR